MPKKGIVMRETAVKDIQELKVHEHQEEALDIVMRWAEKERVHTNSPQHLEYSLREHQYNL